MNKPFSRQNVFLHEGEVTINVEFRIAELPNYMKMIAFLSGELGKSATLFSSFANVCNDNASEINGTFGEKANNTWHSWEYSVRLCVVKKVDVLKETLSWQKLAQHTKKSKITALIAKLKAGYEPGRPLEWSVQGGSTCAQRVICYRRPEHSCSSILSRSTSCAVLPVRRYFFHGHICIATCSTRMHLYHP